MIQTKEFTDLPVNRAEALRYAFCRRPDEAANALLDQCLLEALPKLSYRVCWKEYPVRLEGKVCDFGDFQLTSRTLAKHLSGCSRAVVFGATVSVDMDRLIAKYGYISPAKGLMMQAIGTERISRQIDNLDFIPLLEERFDFVIKKEMMETDAVKKLMQVLKDPAFRKEIAHFSGNDYRDLGKIITEV